MRLEDISDNSEDYTDNSKEDINLSDTELDDEEETDLEEEEEEEVTMPRTPGRNRARAAPARQSTKKKPIQRNEDEDAAVYRRAKNSVDELHRARKFEKSIKLK